MKKLFIISIILLLPIILMAQINCPNLMERDSILAATRTTVDIWFNSSNSLTNPILEPKDVDINLYAKMTGASTSGDTLILDLYGLRRIKRKGNVNWRGVGQTETIALDSMRIFSVPIDTGETYWWRIPLRKLNHYYGDYDGMRPVYRSTGSAVDTTDTIEVQIQFRIWE